MTPLVLSSNLPQFGWFYLLSSLVTGLCDNLILTMSSLMTFLRMTSTWPNLLGLLTLLIQTEYASFTVLCMASNRPLGPGLNVSTFYFINLVFTLSELIVFSSLSLKMVTLSISLSMWMMFSSQAVLLLKCSTLSINYKPSLPWKILAPYPISLGLNSIPLLRVFFYYNKNTSMRSSTKPI